MGISLPAMWMFQPHLVFLVVPLIAQHQDAQGFEGEAPDHAESVGFAQQEDIAAAGENRQDLQHRHGVQHAVGGSEFLVRLAEPVEQDAVLGYAVQHAVDADQGGVDGAGQNQDSDDDDEDVEDKLAACRVPRSSSTSPPIMLS